MTSFRERADFLWSLAEILRGDYKQSEYGKVILPLVVLRRLDCVLEPTKTKVLAKHAELKKKGITNVELPLRRVSGQQFYNVSKLDFEKLLGDQDNIADQLRAYIAGFDPDARDIVEKFKFDEQITKLDEAGLLFLLTKRFCEVDLHPDAVDNVEMGLMFEELIRKFSEQSNETAGEHFTPREVVKLMVNLLFAEDDAFLSKKGTVKTLYDPACGTGGMLSVAEEHLRHLHAAARLEVFGQELNDESYAICRSDMMLKGHDASRIHFGNSFTKDGFPDERFDYMLSNPPFGVDWKKVEDDIRKEAKNLGDAGRFGAGLPRIDDGSLLFLQHMISKMRARAKGGSRIAIVFNASPLTTGSAGSGESEIRRWLIENDWVEAIIALPDQLFYNTGIFTYIWIVSDRKSESRRNRIQLIDGRELFEKMRVSLGQKRHRLGDRDIEEITRLYSNMTDDGERSRFFDTDAFGYNKITVERPLRLRLELTDDAIDRVGNLPGLEKAAAKDKLGRSEEQIHAAVVDALRTIDRDGSDDVDGSIAAALKAAKLPGTLRASIVKTVCVRDPDAPVIADKKGNPKPDPELRDTENVPFGTAIDDYFATDVLPFVPDAWVDVTKTRVGYEIPLRRHFFRYKPPRPLAKIDAEVKEAEAEILALVGEVAA